jgi:hypothetical protein
MYVFRNKLQDDSIGDTAQLPPVNLDISPALIQTLSLNYNKEVEYIELG